MEDTEFHTLVVTENEQGQRLDRVLAGRYPTQSRSYFQALIEEGYVSLNGKDLISKSAKPKAGDEICVEFMTPERDLPIVPEDIPLDILYEDQHLVAVNKPAGMVVHPAPGNWTGTLVHALAHRYDNHLQLGGARPGIVHRIDKGTSGVILVARTSDAHRALTRMFAERTIEKTYLGVSVGNPAGPGCISRVLEIPVGRSRVDRLRMAVMTEEEGGKPARSVVTVLAKDDRALLHAVHVRLETGRTHQIRVHLRHAKAPLLGDALYGALDVNRKFSTAAPRPMLHAQRVRFCHPITMQPVDIIAPLPTDMRTLLLRSVYPSMLEEHCDW